MAEQDRARREALTRLRRIEGQIRGLQRMLEEGQECEAILTQLMAARAALDKAGLLIARRYLGECLKDADNAQVGERLQRVADLFLRLS